jgi:error-prone DNA polymerase
MRHDLARQKIATCADVLAARDGPWLTVAGLVLVRQMPASASGVIFATIEDETGHANLIVWPSLFERQRRTVLSSSAAACRGKVQREGEVIHVVAHNLIDLSLPNARAMRRGSIALRTRAFQRRAIFPSLTCEVITDSR